MTNLRIDLKDLTDDEMFKLALKAYLLRVDPRKRWSKSEIKEHARVAVIRIVSDLLERELEINLREE
jgi:hypothetical protein